MAWNGILDDEPPENGNRKTQLMICNTCGLHAYVVTKEGIVSDSLFSKQDARACAQYFFKFGKISEVEMHDLQRQIRESQLLHELPGDIRAALEADSTLEASLERCLLWAPEEGLAPIGVTPEEYEDRIHEILAPFFSEFTSLEH